MHIGNKKILKEFENVTLVSGVVNGIEDCVWTEIDGKVFRPEHIGYSDDIALEDYEELIIHKRSNRPNGNI